FPQLSVVSRNRLGIMSFKILLLRMAFNALKHRDIAEINRMLKWLVRFVARLAFSVSQASEIDGMLKRPGSRIVFRRSPRIVDYRVADVAIIPDHLACIANVLTVMTAEAS